MCAENTLTIPFEFYFTNIENRINTKLHNQFLNYTILCDKDRVIFDFDLDKYYDDINKTNFFGKLPTTYAFELNFVNMFYKIIKYSKYSKYFKNKNLIEDIFINIYSNLSIHYIQFLSRRNMFKYLIRNCNLNLITHITYNRRIKQYLFNNNRLLNDIRLYNYLRKHQIKYKYIYISRV